jgi:hypothetical protein
MSLDTLQSLILAARSEGDSDLASWLAGAADDPELLAQILGTDRAESEVTDEVGRWLLEHGFSGTVTDAAGRKQTYVDGKHVSGQHGDDGSAGAHTTHEQDTAAASQQHDSAPAEEKGRFAKAAGAIKAKLQKSAGGRAVLAMGKGGMWLFHKIERPLLYAMHKTEEVAVAAARERGFSDEATAKLKRNLLAADFFAGYITGGAALAIAGPVAGKIAAVMPSVSVAYLAYSTAKNPLATWRAAKKVVANTFTRGATVHESEQERTRITPELAGSIADRIDRSDVDSEWWTACFHAALAHTLGDVAKAVELADAAVEAMPTEPQGEM